MKLNTLVEQANRLIDRSSYRRNNSKEQRKLHHQLLQQRCQTQKLNPEEYAFLVVEPAPKLAATIEAKRQQESGPRKPLYKMYVCGVCSIMLSRRLEAAKVLMQVNKMYDIKSTESMHLFNYDIKRIVNASTHSIDVDEKVGDLFETIRDPEDNFIYLFFNTTESF